MGAIYLRFGDEFVAMTESPYEAEVVLQTLLAEHPEILAGSDRSAPGGDWLLVRQEAGVAATEDGGSRWSLDHLFLDAAGVPTLVEVKRSSDTRARREVVAQMLDYAANAISFWRVEQLQEWFEEQCRRQGTDASSVLETTFGVLDPDGYWATVQTNLVADRIRLVFVADIIAPELRSIVEFLNRQMRETEVIAIEVKQYVDADGTRQTIVPSVVGRTEAARAAKGPSPRGVNRAVDFSNPPPGFNELVTRMDAFAAERGLTVRVVSTGRNYQPAITEAGAKHTSGVGVYITSRQTELNLAIFRELGADAVADDLLDRARRVTGLNVTARAWPAFPCEAVLNDWERARRELIEPYFEARAQLPK